MGMVTINGLDVIRGALRFPRIGRWTAEVKVDSEDNITGAATLAIEDGPTFKGAVVQGGEFAALASIQVVGGTDGLGAAARPRHYASTRVGSVVGDLLRDAGETLSSTSDQSVLNRTLPAWTSAAIPTGHILKRLLATLGGDIAWRTLADGSIWIGAEMWPDSGFSAADVDIVAQDDENGYVVLALDLPTLMPGTLLLGQRVSYVEYDIENRLRAKVWFEQAGAASDRLKATFDGAVAGAVPDVDYAARYLAQIVSQSGQTIDVQPEDSRLPSMASVPLLTGLPQTSVDGTIGGRVLVGWSGKDPSRPYAESFDSGTVATNIAIAGGGAPAARAGDSVTLTMTPVDIANLAAALLATGGFVSTGSTPSPPPSPVEFLGGTIVTGSLIVQVGG